MNEICRPLVVPVTALVFIAVILGCNEDSSSTRQQQTSNLRHVLTLHAYAGRRLGHPPRSEEEFKSFIQGEGDKILERLKLDSADQLLTSARDGKPYVVLYDQPASEAAAGVVAYESEGVDGRRQVGYQTGEVRELNAEQFSALGL